MHSIINKVIGGGGGGGVTTAAIPPPPQLLDPYERGKQLRQHDAAKPTPGSNSTRHILKPAGTKEVGGSEASIRHTHDYST